MIYTQIAQRPHSLSLADACSAVRVSRDAFGAWQQHPAAPGDPAVQQVKRIANKHTCYGYRKVAAELRRKGTPINRKKVARIMQEQGLSAKRKKRYVPRTTQSKHNLKVHPNRLKGLVVTMLNQVWVADITYVHLLHGFVYLAVIMDRYSRKCVGWQLSRSIDAQLCLDALKMAIRRRKHLGLKGLIHHSDQGVQYASSVYVTELERHGILPSMSAKGYAYDNAFAESFIKTVKYEEVYLNEYLDFEDAYRNIERFIEKVYNQKRLHSAIGYMPPAEFEREVLKKIES